MTYFGVKHFQIVFEHVGANYCSSQDEKVVTEGRIIVARDRPTRDHNPPPQMQRGAFSVDSGGEYLVGHGNNFLGSPGNLIMIQIFCTVVAT